MIKKFLVIFLILTFYGAACQKSSPMENPTEQPDFQITATSDHLLRTSTLAVVDITSTSTMGSKTSTPSPTLTQTKPITFSPTVLQQSSIEDKMADIQLFLSDKAAAEEFSGSVLIAYQGNTLLQAAYGFADRNQEIPNQIDTKFNLGSIDKMFTAIAILQLVEKGELSLDNEIAKYLPDYPNADISNTVTIHQLLTHTSGLGNYFESSEYPDKHDQLRTIEDYFLLFDELPLMFQAGSQFAYSNSGYIVLGMIIEAVSGQNYYHYLQEHIFKPSGMVATACYEIDTDVPNLAIGYTSLDLDGNDIGGIKDNFSILPVRGGSAGGGYSNALDLLAFSKALLNNQLLNSAFTQLVMEGKIQIADNVQYAYGFFDRTIQGYEVVGHGGGFPGICSIFSIFTELDYTVVVLSNSDYDCLEVDDYIKSKLVD